VEWGVSYRIHTKATVKPRFREGFKWAFRGFKP